MSHKRAVRSRHVYFMLCLCAAIAVLSVAARVIAQPVNDEKVLERSLANAYLYVASRVVWPSGGERKDTFVFCVHSSHGLIELFSGMLPGKKIDERLITLRTVDPNDVQTQEGCELIALSKNEGANRKVSEHFLGKSVLTISDEVDVTEYGGLVYLAHDQKLQPPKINIANLKASGLKLDASLLDLSVRRWGNKE